MESLSFGELPFSKKLAICAKWSIFPCVLPKLKQTRIGAWAVNVSKHLSSFTSTSIGLHELENLFFAGKCGSLLIKLSADSEERLTETRVSAHARFCGITKQELPTYIATLKQFGCVDTDASGSDYVILAFSRARVLGTCAKILAGAPLGVVENAMPLLLEYCLLRPRLQSEIESEFCTVLDALGVQSLLRLAESFSLLGVVTIAGSPEKLYFNAHQFNERASDKKLISAVGYASGVESGFWNHTPAKTI